MHLARFGFSVVCLSCFAWQSVVADSGPTSKKQTATGKKSTIHAQRASEKMTPLQALKVTPTIDVMHDHSPITLQGGVTGANGLPLPGATIWITNTHHTVAITNSAGNFTFTLPNNASISLSCGYGSSDAQTVLLARPSAQEGVFFNLPVTPTMRRKR